MTICFTYGESLITPWESTPRRLAETSDSLTTDASFGLNPTFTKTSSQKDFRAAAFTVTAFAPSVNAFASYGL
jgi:hypothetical protein